jgi:type III secretion YscU/HrpY family protein
VSEGEEKTEPPSEFKLKEAEKKGQVAKSADVTALITFSFAVFFLFFFLPYGFQKIMKFWLHFHQGRYLSNEISFSQINNALKKSLDLWFYLSIPVMLIAFLGAVLGNLCQFGFLLSKDPVKPDIKRINPISGFKKLFSKDHFVELIKQILKFLAIVFVIYLTIKNSLTKIIMLFRFQLSLVLVLIGDLISLIIVRVLLCFFLIAVIDFFWQRYSFLKSMRMSKYEVKKEHKQQEGDPQIKSERRRIQNEALEALSQNFSPDASVVITNPSHLAVALKYNEDIDEAPFLAAKGIGAQAKLIVEKANLYSIPVIRNVPLARDLQWLDINEEIPKHLYDSVAEILVFVHELNNKKSEEEKR